MRDMVFGVGPTLKEPPTPCSAQASPILSISTSFHEEWHSGTQPRVSACLLPPLVAVTRPMLQWNDVEYKVALVQPDSMRASHRAEMPLAGWPLAICFIGLAGSPDKVLSEWAAILALNAKEPFVLAAPKRPTGNWWFINDESHWGWAKGCFQQGTLNRYASWIVALCSSLQIDRKRTALLGYSGGAYAAVELFAHPWVRCSALGIGGVHGHGQSDSRGVPPRHAAGVEEKFAAFLQRLRSHNGAAWIDITHAEHDHYCRVEDASLIVSCLKSRQEELGLAAVHFRILQPGSKKNKSQHSYLKETFSRTDFLTRLFSDNGFQTSCPQEAFCSSSPISPKHLLPPPPPLGPPPQQTGIDYNDMSNSHLHTLQPSKFQPSSTSTALSAAEAVLAPLARLWFSERLGELLSANIDDQDASILRFVWPAGRGSAYFFHGGVVLNVLDGHSPCRFKLCPQSSNSGAGPIVWLPAMDDGVPEVWYATSVEASAKACHCFAVSDVSFPASSCTPSSTKDYETFSQRAQTPSTTADANFDRDSVAEAAHEQHIGDMISVPFVEADKARGKLSFAFCTVVKDQLRHLRQVLPVCLANNWRHRGWVRFYIVDFGSTDGSVAFIQSTCREFIKAGLLHLYTADSPAWNISVAKNTAFLLAAEDVLVDLDVGSILDSDFAPQVRQRFEETNIHGLRVTGGPGASEIIACLRKDFEHVRGYDVPCRSQDFDLIPHLHQVFGEEAVPFASDIAFRVVPNARQGIFKQHAHLRAVVRHQGLPSGVSASRLPLPEDMVYH